MGDGGNKPMSLFTEGMTATAILAAVLSWFMLRLEGIMTKNTAALDKLSKAIVKCPLILEEDK